VLREISLKSCRSSHGHKLISQQQLLIAAQAPELIRMRQRPMKSVRFYVSLLNFDNKLHGLTLNFRSG
jgi:hypothetical protein